jgi:hypothetical protein
MPQPLTLLASEHSKAFVSRVAAGFILLATQKRRMMKTQPVQTVDAHAETKGASHGFNMV